MCWCNDSRLGRRPIDLTMHLFPAEALAFCQAPEYNTMTLHKVGTRHLSIRPSRSTLLARIAAGEPIYLHDGNEIDL